MSRAVTPIAFVQAILLAYQRYGVDPGAALVQAHIPPALLMQPEARISALQVERFCAAAMQQLDDEALGWWSRRLPWGSYGMLARASLTAPDLGVALARWCRHHRLICDDLNPVLDTGWAAQAELRLEEIHPPWPGTRELCLLSTLRNIHGYASWLVDSRIPLRTATFPFPAPAHAEVYPLLFGCPVSFGAPAAALLFDPAELRLPVLRDEAAARRMLKRALPLTVHLYRRDRLLIPRVRDHLAREPARMVNAEAIAAALHVSARTLHRQLQAEGTTLQALKDEARRGQAEALLRHGRQPIKQVAQAVGFRSEKSFSRAFQLWTGLSPGRFRRRDEPAA